MSKPEFVYVTSIESMLEIGTALAIPPASLGIEGVS